MKYNLIRTVVVILSFIIAMNFEMAVQTRGVLLSGLAMTFALLPFIRGREHNRFGWSLLVDVMVVFALNYYSRFNINTIFVLLNLWILLETALWQPPVRGLLLTVLTFIGSFLSFAYSLEYGMNYQLLSQAAFIEVVFVLFSVMVFTYKSYVTEREQVNKLNETLKLQNDRLIGTNEDLINSKEALEAANLEVVRLTRLKERSQIARDLHDTLGHELTGLIMSLEMLKMSADTKTSGEIHEGLQASVDQSREILRAMRSLVSAHKDIIVHDNLYNALSRKFYQFQTQTGLVIQFNFELFDEWIDEEMSDVLYRTVLESITNTAKHSKAKKIWISFQSLNEQQILLKIHDNGGCLTGFIKGNGLCFIEERIKRLMGTTQFECDETGFRTTVKLPIIQGGIND